MDSASRPYREDSVYIVGIEREARPFNPPVDAFAEQLTNFIPSNDHSDFRLDSRNREDWLSLATLGRQGRIDR